VSADVDVVVSAGWQLKIYALSPEQILSNCRAETMGVILGVVVNTIVAKKQKNLLTQQSIDKSACLMFGCRVPCQAWKTEYIIT